MSKKTLILIVILAIPTFGLMLRNGVFSMQDFHLFRQYEFNKCIQDWVFPCRWTPDAGMGYGEPLFNFYGQFPYWIGQLVGGLGFSIIDSVKLLFILTITLSGLAMYYVSRQFWGEKGGIISAIVYMYAPYRAVDVWVRGALNESLAFVFYPLIFYSLDQYTRFRRGPNLWVLVISTVMLVTTHNLSVIMFLPFLGIWWLVRLARTKNIQSVGRLILAAVLVLGLAAYYLTPIIFENSLVTLTKTTQGYYDYRAHFATLSQLFISRFWGYGASLWGPVDDLSFSIGQFNWILAGGTAVVVLFKRNWREQKLNFYLLLFLAVGALFLTHNKSQFIWERLPFLAFVQFPWRFLGVALFFLSLASGAAAHLLSRSWAIIIVIAVVLAAIITNVYYFRPDIWRDITDAQQFSGQLWAEQRSSALQDYWPASAPNQPVDFAPVWPGAVIKSQSAFFPIGNVQGQVNFPIVYFPGWQATVGDQNLQIYPDGDLGLITANLPAGTSEVNLVFTNTWPRRLGNLISGLSFAILTVWLAWYLKKRGWRWS